MKHSVRDMSEVDIIRCKDLHNLDFDNLAEVISEAFRTEQEFVSICAVIFRRKSSISHHVLNLHSNNNEYP
jgi:hypothetical protein